MSYDKVLVLLFLFAWSGIFAQDQIITKTGEILQVRIVKEEKKEISYFLSGDPEKALNTMSKKNIKKYLFEEILSETNLIVLKNDELKGQELLSEIIRFLLAEGYQIESFNMDDLTVNTKYFEAHRITAEIVDHEAQFQCFYAENNDLGYPPTTGRFYYGTKENEGEKRAYSRHKGFKSLDRLLRSYLVNQHSELSYRATIFK